ncbi:hypothetical protein FBZ94_103210 [Bradyrhizobium sacchari]|uniref:Uncharacterized protein n=1 Tax=Bradyrhizobium sacchari TaxID=1399419 RepID=A0A560JZP5_9BRAD|nr:hypothetical protein FBZ94_103210 [Bradyrhizobium sacchari]TWB76555.1 hypothetical protein FBZ95_104740 [Bradyrhizobium sacchari]
MSARRALCSLSTSLQPRVGLMLRLVWLHPTPLAHRASDPPPPEEGEVKRFRGAVASTESYTAAVVTPPSMTMVWPVMKLEASDAR